MSPNIMIFNTICYYDLYIFLIPYLVFGTTYVFCLLEILFLRLFKKYVVIYYPDETSWMSANLMIVLPRRLAFELVYFAKMKNLSLINILVCISIVLIIGLPFIVIVFLFLLIKHRKLLRIWRTISTYKNLKLIINNGKITRNMKKIGDKGMQASEVISKAGELSGAGLVRTDKGTHLVSYSKESRIGNTHTSKEQLNSKAFEIKNDGKSFAYAQIFGENKGNIDFENVKNTGLSKEFSPINVLKSNLKVSTSNESHILLNEHNKQTWVLLEAKQKKLSKKFLDSCGGIEKARETIAFTQYYDVTMEDAKKLVYIMANSDKEKRVKIYLEHKDVYDRLIVLEKSNVGGEGEKIGKIIAKIEELLNI